MGEKRAAAPRLPEVAPRLAIHKGLSSFRLSALKVGQKVDTGVPKRLIVPELKATVATETVSRKRVSPVVVDDRRAVIRTLGSV